MSVDPATGLAGVSYTKPQLSQDAPIILDNPVYEELYRPSMPLHPFYTYFDKPFNKERYLYANPPIHIGPFSVEANINVLRCPIKVAGTRKLVIPRELGSLLPFIKHCCIYEQTFNPNFEKLFAHITVDKQQAKARSTQRVPGFHVDGFQGSKFPEKHEIEHSYLWSSCFGTEFCVQPFFINHIDESKYLVFDEMNFQANEDNIVTCLDGNVYLFDPYMVHRSPEVTRDCERLIVRITFEYSKLLDPNDTANPHFPFKVPYKYDVRNRLAEYPYVIPSETYGYHIWSRL